MAHGTTAQTYRQDSTTLYSVERCKMDGYVIVNWRNSKNEIWDVDDSPCAKRNKFWNAVGIRVIAQTLKALLYAVI